MLMGAPVASGSFGKGGDEERGRGERPVDDGIRAEDTFDES